jgi:hypothetical protein
MDADETKFLPNRPASSEPEPTKTDNEPFEFGDRTLFQLRSQDFHPDEEFGTVVMRPQKAQSDAEGAADSPAAPIATADPLPDDPIARIEHKLDLALRQIQALQHRLESLDAAVAKALLR